MLARFAIAGHRRALQVYFAKPDRLHDRIGAAKGIELLLGVLDVARHRAGSDREDLADLVIGLAHCDPLHDLALARGERRVGDLLALRADEGARQRVMAVDADDLDRGAGARRQIGLEAARTEQGYRSRAIDDRHYETIARAELARLVDDRTLRLLKVPPVANVAPGVRIDVGAQLFDHGIVDHVVLLGIPLDVFLGPVIEQNTVLELGSGPRQREAGHAREAEPFQLPHDQRANVVIVRELLQALHEIERSLAVFVAVAHACPPS